jgi:hypothetical protein
MPAQQPRPCVEQEDVVGQQVALTVADRTKAARP